MGVPRVTVLLPVRNGERFLAPAVDSVLGQTFPDFELLVVNDGSTDGTARILSAYSDPRVRVSDNPGPHGFDAALNHGLALAQGEYLARMDADDVCAPDRLARQVAYLDSHPEVGVLGSNTQPVDAHGHPVRSPARRLPTLPLHVRWRLFLYNCVNHPTVMFRTAVLREVGGYNPAVFPADDYELWLRMLPVTEVANLPHVLLEYRQHEASVTSTSSRHEKSAMELAVLAEAHARIVGTPVSPVALAVLRDPRQVRERDGSQLTLTEAVDALVRATDHCLRRRPASRLERELIRRGAARRLARLLATVMSQRPTGVWKSVPSSAFHALRYLAHGELDRVGRRWERLTREGRGHA